LIAGGNGGTITAEAVGRGSAAAGGNKDVSVETKRQESYQIIRLETDMVMESDAAVIKNTIEQALQVGIKRFVFSVSIGSLANKMIVSRLLLWCKQAIRHGKGELLFVEKSRGQKSVFGALCESLHIPMYQDCETAIVVAAGTGAATVAERK
jgi:hypothetical protein